MKTVLQTFKTICENCGEEVKKQTLIVNGENEIIIEFLKEKEFYCECGTTTYIQIEKYTD